MEVTYELSKEDISQLFRYIRNHRSQIRPIFVYIGVGIMGFIVIASTLLFLLRPPNGQGDSPWSALLIMLVAIAWLSYRMIVRPLMAEREAQRNPQVVSRKTMQISASGVYVKHSLGEITLHWPLIVDIIDDRDCYYLFLEKNNALTVPKSAFDSPDEAKRFYETARQDWQTAKNLAGPNQAADPATWPPPPRTANSQEPDSNTSH